MDVLHDKHGIHVLGIFVFNIIPSK